MEDFDKSLEAVRTQRYNGFMAKVMKLSGSSLEPAEAELAAPVGWVESLIRGKAQIAAGQTVPLEPVLARLRASIARMEAKRTSAKDN